jgi:hypothetical protein
MRLTPLADFFHDGGGHIRREETTMHFRSRIALFATMLSLLFLAAPAQAQVQGRQWRPDQPGQAQLRQLLALQQYSLQATLQQNALLNRNQLLQYPLVVPMQQNVFPNQLPQLNPALPADQQQLITQLQQFITMQQAQNADLTPLQQQLAALQLQIALGQQQRQPFLGR